MYLLGAEPIQEKQIQFDGTTYDEKGHEMKFLAAKDRFSNFPTACIFDKMTGPNVTKILKISIENHGTPSSIRLDQAKCLMGHQRKYFCNKKKDILLKLQLTIIELLDW